METRTGRAASETFRPMLSTLLSPRDRTSSVRRRSSAAPDRPMPASDPIGRGDGGEPATAEMRKASSHLRNRTIARKRIRATDQRDSATTGGNAQVIRKSYRGQP